MGGMSIGHWIVVAIIVVVLFGSGRLRSLGGDLGAAIQGFKKAMKEEEQKPDQITQRETKPNDQDPVS